METLADFIVLGSKITVDNDRSHEIKRLLGRKTMINLHSVLKSRDITLPTKVHTVTAMFFPVVMYGCESWTIKKAWAPNWCFWTMVLERLESPLDSKEVKPVNPKGNQPLIFIGRTDAEAEAPVLWPSDAKSWHFGEDPDTGKDWRQEEKRLTEDEIIGWHHLLNGHEFERASGVSEGQGILECCRPWGCNELDTIEGLNDISWKSHLTFYASIYLPLY